MRGFTTRSTKQHLPANHLVEDLPQVPGRPGAINQTTPKEETMKPKIKKVHSAAKPIKETTTSASDDKNLPIVQAKYAKIEDKSSPEARKLRRILRKMGAGVSKTK